MTATTLPRTDRREFLGWVLLGGFGMALAAVAAVPLPQIDTSSKHAALRHGLAEVLTVRAAMRAMASRNPAWFDRPPCKDGRLRYILKIGGKWLVWVLIRHDGILHEVTAFVTKSQDYVKSVSDNCGNGFGYA